MLKKLSTFILVSCVLVLGMTGCGNRTNFQNGQSVTNEQSKENANAQIKSIGLSDSMQQLDNGLSAIAFQGNDGFTQFLEAGGASSDSGVVAYSFRMIAEIATNENLEQIQDEIMLQMRNILKEKGLDFVAFSVTNVRKIRPDAKTGKKNLILDSE